MPRTLDQLYATLRGLEGASYGAYKRIRGSWSDDEMTLHVERVQGDPFATPSVVRLEVAAASHGIPERLWGGSRARRIALEDFLLRRWSQSLAERRPGPGGRARGSGKSGGFFLETPGPAVLERAAVRIDSESLSLALRVGLPAQGRRILGRFAAELLTEALPDASMDLAWDALDQTAVDEHLCLAEDHAHLQSELPRRGLVAFIRNGSVLPRASGVSSAPLEGAVSFASPASFEVSLPTRHHGAVVGLGIPDGVTLLTGGGFHGKTTVLEAIQSGVAPHVAGDGREWVITRDDAMKVRSEDGRSVTGVNLEAFVSDLPLGRSTADFTTKDASGSTSLAAMIVESIEAGSRLLLFDEDTCATNLLVRDARMQALVRRETLVPLVDRVRELFESAGVSTLLVLGGSGDALDAADRVLLLEDYRLRDATGDARTVAAEMPSQRRGAPSPAEWRLPPRQVAGRCLLATRGDARGRRRVRARGLRELEVGDRVIDLMALEQLVEEGQAKALGVLLDETGRQLGASGELREAVAQALAQAKKVGLFALGEAAPELVMPRASELFAAASRVRGLEVVPPGQTSA